MPAKKNQIQIVEEIERIIVEVSELPGS